MFEYYPAEPTLRYSPPPRRRGGKTRARFPVWPLEWDTPWRQSVYRSEMRRLSVLLDRLRARAQPSVKAKIEKDLMAHPRADRRKLAHALGIPLSLDHRPLL